MPDDAARPVSADDAALAAQVAGADAARIAAPGDPAGAGFELPPPAAGMSREDADQLARLGLDWVLDAACRQYPVLTYPEETRAHGARLAGAVLAKYDVLAWAGRWRAEFELGVFVAGLAWRSYQLVTAPRAAPVTSQAPAAPSPSQSPPAA